LNRRAFRNLRLQEINAHDIERMLRTNGDELVERNEQMGEFLERNEGGLPEHERTRILTEIDNDAAEAISMYSLQAQVDDVYAHFSSGPLFRKDRDAK
jgi:hypothetical protein